MRRNRRGVGSELRAKLRVLRTQALDLVQRAGKLGVEAALEIVQLDGQILNLCDGHVSDVDASALVGGLRLRATALRGRKGMLRPWLAIAPTQCTRLRRQKTGRPGERRLAGGEATYARLCASCYSAAPRGSETKGGNRCLPR